MTMRPDDTAYWFQAAMRDLRDLTTDDRTTHNHAGVYLVRDSTEQKEKIRAVHAEAVGFASY